MSLFLCVKNYLNKKFESVYFRTKRIIKYINELEIIDKSVQKS